MSVDALYRPRLEELIPSVERLAEWAGRRSNAPPHITGPQATDPVTWIDRLGWVLGGSFITCCLALSWVEYRPAAEGIDVNLLFDPDLLPERLVVSSGDGGCSAGLQRPVPGATYVFEQACVSHTLLEAIHCVGAFFISPLARDAVFRVIEIMPITQRSRRHGGFGDWVIELHESPRWQKSGLACRLTTHWAGEGQVRHLITNRLDLRSSVVFGIYKHRHEIASFLEQVRRSRAQRSLLGSGRGLSPFRLFGSLLILRTWQWIARRVRRRQQEMAKAMGELEHDVLGLRPRSDTIHYSPDARGTRSLASEAGLTVSFLQPPPDGHRDAKLARG